MQIVPKPNSCKQQAGFYLVPESSEISCVEKTDDSVSAEGYHLKITQSKVEITASTPQGLFYAKKSLQQLRNIYGRQIPCFTITDSPAFSYRGFMIDCCRHFFPIAQLKQMIEAAALFKLNRFHWHLTDDQGWRIAVEQYPRLTEIGASRPFSKFGRRYEPGEHSGFYSKNEIREIVQFCKERFIEVIPEFEIPGHASAALAAYPEFSCSGNPVQIKTGGGIFSDIMCAGKAETYHFIETILEEMTELFPFELFHIGGDEAPKVNWRSCPHCQAKMREQGLQNEQELQAHLTNHVAAYLKNKGKTAIVWNDAMKGAAIDESIIAQYWMGKPESVEKHLHNGGKMIASEFFHYYLDYSYGQTPLRKTYQYNPIPINAEKSAVLGVEAPIWTEYISDLSRMSYLAWPRLAAVAETGWTQAEHKNYAAFKEHIAKLIPMLQDLGLQPAPVADWNPNPIKKVNTLAKFWLNTVTMDGVRLLRDQAKERKEEKR